MAKKQKDWIDRLIESLKEFFDNVWFVILLAVQGYSMWMFLGFFSGFVEGATGDTSYIYFSLGLIISTLLIEWEIYSSLKRNRKTVNP